MTRDFVKEDRGLVELAEMLDRSERRRALSVQARYEERRKVGRGRVHLDKRDQIPAVEPLDALAGVTRMRLLLEHVELCEVFDALRAGAAWDDVADVLSREVDEVQTTFTALLADKETRRGLVWGSQLAVLLKLLAAADRGPHLTIVKDHDEGDPL